MNSSKMYTLKQFLFSAMLMFLITSTYGQIIYYSPTPVSDIGLIHKDDFKLLISNIGAMDLKEYGNKSFVSGLNDFDLTLATAPINHFGVYFNATAYSESFNENLIEFPSQENDQAGFNQFFANTGLGYFTKFGDLGFEFYGFAGIGKMDARNQLNHTIDAFMLKRGLRTAFILNLGKFDIGAAFSYAYLDYLRVGSPTLDYDINELHNLKNHSDQNVFESGVNLKYRISDFKIKAEIGSAGTTDRDFKMNNIYYGLGLVIEIDDLIRKITSI